MAKNKRGDGLHGFTDLPDTVKSFVMAPKSNLHFFAMNNLNAIMDFFVTSQVIPND